MPRTDTRYPGSGLDLAVQVDGQLVVATVEGPRVRLQRGGGILHTPPAPRWLLARTLRMAVASDGEIALVCQVTEPDQAALYLRGTWRILPYGLWGQAPIGIAAIGRTFVWAVVTGSGGTLLTQHEDGTTDYGPIPNGGTSQGILFHDGQRFVLADARKNVDGLFHGTTVGDWTAGYGDDCGIVQRLPYRYTVVQGNPSTPRLAVFGDTVHVGYSFDGKPTVTTLTPPYPVDPIAAPAPMVRIGRPLSLAFFEFTPASLPGNAELRQVSTWEWSLLQDGRKVGVYVSGEPDGDLVALERSIAAVKGRGLPVYAYWPRKLQEGRLPRYADVLAVEAYRLKDETLLAFETRVRAALRRCGRAALACQCYTSNAGNHPDLRALVPVYARIAKDTPTVEALLVFSGSGRPTGYQDHPEVHGLWRDLAAGIPRAPELPQQPTPQPTPAPTPPEDDMPKMTYDEGLAVVLKAKEKWRRIHRPDEPMTNDVDAGQAFQWAWRAMYEGWSEAQILEDVK